MRKRFSLPTFLACGALSTSMHNYSHSFRFTHDIADILRMSRMLVNWCTLCHSCLKQWSEAMKHKVSAQFYCYLFSNNFIGMGAEQILSLFQDILASSKQKFLPKWHPIFATMDDKALVEMFMSFLSNADAVRILRFSFSNIVNTIFCRLSPSWRTSEM